MPAIYPAKQISSLGPLADPAQFVEALTITPAFQDQCKDFLRSMIRIRVVEEAIAQLVEAGLAKCPCHLGIGQEAIAVGVASALTPRDAIFGGHRSHSHYLAVGGSVISLISEVLGKLQGCSKGMGGSMHLWDKSVGFLGSVPIVGATIPIAVGAALALKRDGEDCVAVCFFGDGASEEGIFHESLNLAAVMRVPVMFVCENNFYSSHLDLRLRQPSDLVSRFAVAHQIEGLVVDGNDVFGVAEAVHKLLDHSRRDRSPSFLEAVTYRWRGHVGPSEDIDVGVRRSREDLEKWKKRDPVRRLADAMTERGILTAEVLAGIFSEERNAVQIACEKARNAPYPPSDQLMSAVFYQEM